MEEVSVCLVSGVVVVVAVVVGGRAQEEEEEEERASFRGRPSSLLSQQIYATFFCASWPHLSFFLILSLDSIHACMLRCLLRDRRHVVFDHLAPPLHCRVCAVQAAKKSRRTRLL